MAELAGVKRFSEPEKPKNGRPPNSRSKPKAEGVFDFAKTSSFQHADDWYRYLEAYPNKTGLSCYVYRLKPKIDLSLVGREETHIMMTSTPAEMTEEYIGSVFGRGKYMLRVIDKNRVAPLKQECAQVWFDCINASKPPLYDPRSLLISEPTNVDEINRLLNLGVLIRDTPNSNPRVATGAERSGNFSSNAPADPYGKIDLGQVLMHLVNRGSEDPQKMVMHTIEMAKVLNGAAGSAPDVETIINRVVDRLKPAAAVDPLQMYMSVAETLKKILPAGVTDSGAPAAPAENGASSWAPHLAGIFSEIRTTLRELPAVVATFREMRGGGSQNGAQQPMQQQPQQKQAQPAALAPIGDRIREVCILGFSQLNKGGKGFDFAAFIWNHFPGGQEVYRTLEPGGAAGLIGLMSMDPSASALLNDAQFRPRLEEFLSDFFTFDPEPSESGVPGEY